VVLAVFGLIGTMGWPVTVVSSNFVSLVLIITLSLIVHLIVRYRELRAADPEAGQSDLLRGTLDSKFTPSVFTALTTAISFGALLFADIQPIKDFGRIMVCAVALGFVATFVLFPAMLAWLRPTPVPRLRGAGARRVNLWIAHWVQGRPVATAVVFVVLAAVGVGGALQLTVENRFIDYFHEDTEIYQGMRLIDRELGGTTPLSVVIDAPQSFLEDNKADQAFAEELGLGSDSGPSPADGYWYNAEKLNRLGDIHDYLDSLDATGKVLSMATIWRLALSINDGEALEPYQLGVLYNRLPDDLRSQLIDPYMRPDGNQVRFDIRVVDSLPGLSRDALLERIRTELPQRFEVSAEQVRLSGLLVLYNDVLQSLFKSQFVTLAIVFVAIMIMFGLLYRSPCLALIGPLPTAVAAALELGLMGWVGLPLDIMTMTIAAIVIGIGVHDTIHYVDRIRDEVTAGRSSARAVEVAHGQVGQAMLYTTIIVTLGFSILVLSNFMPTIYFGLLTGVAMVFALINNFFLLPVLVQWTRP
jgi:predicted RND superfamily exporter protein